MSVKIKSVSILCLILAFVLAFSMTFVGCKEEAAETTAAETTAAETTAAETTAAETTAAETTAAAGPVTITWWDWQAGLGENLLDGIFAKYMDENPNVTIERRELPNADYNTALKTDMAAGIGPDLFELEPGAPTVELVNAGTLKDLTDIVKNDNEWSSWIEPALKLKDPYVEGKLYSIPIDVNNLPIVYWKELFESRGIQPPETLDDLKAAADALNADGIVPLTTMVAENWPQIDIFVALSRGADKSGDLLDRAIIGEASWEDPLFKEVMQAIVKLKDDKIFPANIMEIGWNECLDMFGKKECAMVYPIGQFGLDALPKDALANDEIGTIAFPKLNADAKTMLTGGSSVAMVVNAESKNLDVAIDVLKFCNSPFGQEAIFDNMMTPPGAVVTKESTIPLFTLQTNNQNTLEIGYRRIDNPDLYAALGDGINQALLGGNIDDILANIEQVSRQAND